MIRSLSFDPAHTAVLCLDYQSAIVSVYAGDQQDQLLSRAASVLRQSRQSGLPVRQATVITAGEFTNDP